MEWLKMSRITRHVLILVVFNLLLHSVTAQDSSLFCFDRATCCQGVPDITSLGDWDNCTLYYICFGGIPSLYQCPNNQEYNPVSKNCVANAEGCVAGTRPPTSSPPTTQITTTTTSDGTIGTTLTTTIPTTTTPGNPGDGNCTEDGGYFIPYPGDCSKYMVCSGGTLLPDALQCPPGTLFDPDRGECNLEHLVECKPNCPDSGTTTFPHDRNCSLYWLCSEGVPSIRQCPPNLVYDYQLGVCNMQDAVLCPNLCPAEVDFVNIPHARNCTLYWMCSFGNPTLRDCPPGLGFDPNLGTCNLESEIPDCGGKLLHFDDYIEDQDLDDLFEDEGESELMLGGKY